MLENKLFEAMFEIMPFGVYVVDIATHKIVYLNKLFRDQFMDTDAGICYHEIFGLDEPCGDCNSLDLIDEQGKPNDKTNIFEFFNERNDKWYQLQEKAISWPDGKTVKYTIAVEITELKATQNRLAEAHAQLAIKNRDLNKLAQTDTLTGLPNRSRIDYLFKKEIDKASRYKRPFAIMMLDVDKFKIINDTFGHQSGDAVLMGMAKIFGETIRSNDMIGRWGGEEFLALLPETNREEALMLGERIRCAIEAQAFATQRQHTISIGIAAFMSGDTLDSLLSRADRALYHAKEMGRNQVSAFVNTEV